MNGVEDKVTKNGIAARLPPIGCTWIVTFERKHKNISYNNEMKQRRNKVQVLYCTSQAVPYLSRKCTLLPERVARSKVLD